MAIQMRRGNESDFDPASLQEAEIAVALDTEKMFIGFGGASCSELVTTPVDGTIAVDKLPTNVPVLDENGTLNIDIMPIGTTWTWWGDSLPSDKWAFGNTEIPENCNRARSIWGQKTPNTAGRVIVDKSSDSEFNAIGKSGGAKSQSLRALIGHVDNDTGTICFCPSGAVQGKEYTLGIRGTAFNGAGKKVNHSTVVTPLDGGTPSMIQPYITARLIFKIK